MITSRILYSILLTYLIASGGMLHGGALPGGALHSGTLMKQPDTGGRVIVPIAGNTWKSPKSAKGGRVTGEGIRNWSDSRESFTTYVYFTQKGALKVSLNLSVPKGRSELQVTINGRSRQVSVSEATPEWVEAGDWRLSDTGYAAITIKGLSRTGSAFGDINSISLDGTATRGQTYYTKNNEGNFFYWGRRGPSVHLSYPIPDSVEAEWFYNEVTVPEGEDVLGSYFMANGFGEGYFGIQVNSPTERRILFSVWSPFKTDDPGEIPEGQKIVMLKKGESVYTGEFGNEGSGGQSYLRYNWKAGITYKFLLHGKPTGKGSTTYTAYFFDPEKNDWMLIASFKRPRTTTWLTRLHSFLENFNPEQGDLERKVWFDNQWIRDKEGNWMELNRAKFTGDNTARVKYRLDYGGGVEKGRFYLKNCGFFSDYTPLDTWHERPETGDKPAIDLKSLPK